MQKEKENAIADVVAGIEKQFGKGSVMRLGADERPAEVSVISTGSLGVDIALGTGGLPKGRIVEIYGPESSGKTTLALQVIAESQRLGGVCAFVDAEHALDVGYARKLGVKSDDLLLAQPDCGEQALEIVEMLVKSEAVDVVVIDSVAALVPRAEIEGEMGDSHVGLHARLMSQALRKLTALVARSKTLVLFINQLRDLPPRAVAFRLVRLGIGGNRSGAALSGWAGPCPGRRAGAARERGSDCIRRLRAKSAVEPEDSLRSGQRYRLHRFHIHD